MTIAKNTSKKKAARNATLPQTTTGGSKHTTTKVTPKKPYSNQYGTFDGTTFKKRKVQT